MNNKLFEINRSTILAILVSSLSACGGGSASDADLAANAKSQPPLSRESAQDTQVKTSAESAAPGTEQVQAGVSISMQREERLPAPVAEIEPNDNGRALTLSIAPILQTSNPFFKPFGNGRSCASCHRASMGMTITPDGIRSAFDATNGTDPIFKPVDGANRPDVAYNTLAEERKAYSMLLNRGVIRVGIGMPVKAEFRLVEVDDPYGFASAKELSLFRRPLPTTNLRYLSTAMWDGRETAMQNNAAQCTAMGATYYVYAYSHCFSSRYTDLTNQANDAVLTHAQGAQSLTQFERDAIADFESSLYTAQIVDNAAGDLRTDGAHGGPTVLLFGKTYFGVNDFVAGDFMTGARFNANVMNLFGKWSNAGADKSVSSATAAARESIARGERIFNQKTFNIVGVNGLNDELGMHSIKGTCSSCHDTPNSGTHSVPLLVNTGVSDVSRRPADPSVAMPLYTFRNIATGAIVRTMDPGRALQTGKWNDIGKMKVPSLRGIETRSPYFHDGSESELSNVVKFYDNRFKIGLTNQEIQDLAAFLRVL